VDLDLKGQAVIVTGGSRGIGIAAATAFLDEGARVMINSLRAASLEAALAQLRGRGDVEGLAGDVAVEADAERLVAETVRRFGRVDVLVANAGIAGEAVNLADMSVEEWDRMLAVHLRGTFLCARAAARALRSAGCRGRIVTIASSSSYESERASGHYATAKAGMLGLTRSMAVDFAQWGIRANSVAPGWVRTDMSAADLPPLGEPLPGCGVMGRAAESDEIADAILFLASGRCPFMTGATLVVDGGQTVVAPDVGSGSPDVPR
jgi:NAD(P)-dependent dehydrogenase (short-subunit alcohol dehydrogenase family)